MAEPISRPVLFVGSTTLRDYPAVIWQLMNAAPFWSIVTDKGSMWDAAPWKKALMFAAGETSTALCSIAPPTP